jgi:hypothetical protein
MEMAVKPQMTLDSEGKKLWLWQINNGVFVAYDNPRPCDENGNPKVVGEPAAAAMIFPSKRGDGSYEN